MKRLPLFVALTAGLIGCRTAVISHDEHLAAKAAQDFAEAAFMRNDVSSAYRMLSGNAKRMFGMEKLQ